MKHFIFALLIGATVSVPAVADDGDNAAKKLEDSYYNSGLKAGSWQGGRDADSLDSAGYSGPAQQSPQGAANNWPGGGGNIPDPNIHPPYHYPHHNFHHDRGGA